MADAGDFGTVTKVEPHLRNWCTLTDLGEIEKF